MLWFPLPLRLCPLFFPLSFPSHFFASCFTYSYLLSSIFLSHASHTSYLWLIPPHVRYLWLMDASHDSWTLLMTHGRFSWLMDASHDSWTLLMTHGRFSWLMDASHDSWMLLMTHGRFSWLIPLSLTHFLSLTHDSLGPAIYIQPYLCVYKV